MLIFYSEIFGFVICVIICKIDVEGIDFVNVIDFFLVVVVFLRDIMCVFEVMR